MTRFQRPALWRVQAEILLSRHGWAGVLALLTALLVAGLELLVLQPQRNELVALRAQLALAATTPPRHDAARSAVLTQQQRELTLAALVRQSPEATALVDAMLAIAAQEQIALHQGEYHTQVHQALEISQLQVTQPLRATYPQLRRYIENVLRTIPTASLDQITARRESVGQAQLEVRLKWSFWMPASPAPAQATTTGTDAPEAKP